MTIRIDTWLILPRCQNGHGQKSIYRNSKNDNATMIVFNMSRRSRGWCFTLNNYTPEEVEVVKGLPCKYIVYGYEVAPTTLTPHLQGFVYFENKKSLKQMKVFLARACFFANDGTNEQAADYCKKDGDFFEVGSLPKSRGKKSTKDRIDQNLELMSRPILELLEDGTISIFSVPTIKKARTIIAQENQTYSHNEVRGVWYYGEPGVGKSRKARDENPDAFIKAQNKWFDGYIGQKVIILDDLDTNVLGHYLKIWADRYSCSGEIKGGVVNLIHEKFIVTSNYHPRDLWTENEQMLQAILRRFKVTQFFKEL